MRKTECALGFYLIGISLMFCSPAPLAAQTDTKDLLIQDLKAFNVRCPGPPASYSTSCANELTQLKRRQQDLNLSDSDLEAAAAKGGFRGGFR